MSALTQFLWEDYLINSDVGEAAKAKAQIEEAEHQKLLKLNEETNKQVRWTHSTPLTVSFSSKQSFPKGCTAIQGITGNVIKVDRGV